MSWLAKNFPSSFQGPLRSLLARVTGDRQFELGETDLQLSDLEEKNAIFFVSCFSMLAKLAKSEQYVSDIELKAIDEVMQGRLHFSPQSRELAIRIFNEAKDDDAPFAAYAGTFYDAYRDEPEMLRVMVEILLLVSKADDDFEAHESAMIDEAVELFGLSESAAAIARCVESHHDIDHCYYLIGSHISDSREEIQTRYREVRAMYEDRLNTDERFPDEFSFYLSEKLTELDNAYTEVQSYLKDRSTN